MASASHHEFSSAPFRVETPTSRCLFGFGRQDITPPVGIYHRMWGAALHDRAEGVHRPLYATVMVFHPQQESLALQQAQVVIALDHCLFGPPEVAALKEAIHHKTGISPDQVVVVFSHTHAAGLLLLDRVSLPGGDLIPEYLAQVNDTVATLTTQAWASLASTTFSHVYGRCTLAAHRDFWDSKAGVLVCGFHPGGPADDTVLVARGTNANGEVVATLVNYACHPTTLAWENRLISPDYPGAMREVIEEAVGGICVFLQGASGELGPREGFVGDPAVADRNGRQLGHAALAAWMSLPPPDTSFEYAGPVVSGATLGAWRHVPLSAEERTAKGAWGIAAADLPIAYRAELPSIEQVTRERTAWQDQETMARAAGDTDKVRDCRAMVERGTRMLARLNLLPPGEKFPYVLRVWRIGDAIWVALQGEPYSVAQTALRSRFPGVPIFVCTIADGWGPSYLPPREMYGSGLYQESIAILEPGSLEQIIDAAAARIRAFLGTDHPNNTLEQEQEAVHDDFQ